MKSIVAVSQMTSTSCRSENIDHCQSLVTRAAGNGAQIICFPENFAFFPNGDEEILNSAENLDGPTITLIKRLARENKIWMSLGGFQERIEHEKKIFNTHLIISAQGEVAAAYRKIHLFVAQLDHDHTYDEARLVKPGDKPVIFSSPFFVGGLSICYDLRFPYLFASLRERGAQVLFIPAAFTDITGTAHWEVLLRARAIENQCYVLASAQVGKHNDKRISYGHAMIVDPWGQILARCADGDEMVIAEVNLQHLNNIRNKMPMISKREWISGDGQ